MAEEAINSPISSKNKIDTVNKTEEYQESNIQLIQQKAIKLTQLNQWINQGLLK